MDTHTATDRLFTDADARQQEARYNVAYFVSTDRRTLLPATHVGPDRIAVITKHPDCGAHRGWIAWVVSDANGRRLISGTEDVFPGCRWMGAYRRAIVAVRRQGAETRVRPGERGPWGAGAFYV